MNARVEEALSQGDTIVIDSAPSVDRRTDDCDLHDLARRCGKLLAQRVTTDCPPGHWLG